MKKIILLLIIISFSTLALENVNYGKEELAYLKIIKKYEDTKPYLTKSELDVVKRLRKSSLKLGCEPDSGIDVGTFKKIMEKHLGINVIIVVKPWSILLEDIKEGDIDLLLNLSYTEEREKFVDYSEAYYIDIAYLTYPLNFDFKTLEQLKGKQLSYTKGSFYKKELDKFSGIFKFKLLPKENLDLNSIDLKNFNVGSRTQVYKLIDQKKTDLNYSELFTQSPVYMGISKRLSDEKKLVIKKIFNSYIKLHLSEFLKIYDENIRKKNIINSLTKEEIIYMENIKVINAAIENTQYPISFYNEEEKKISGSWINILKSLDLNLKYNSVLSYEECLEFLDQNNLNGVALIPINVNNLKRYNISNPLYTISYFLVNNKYNKFQRNKIEEIGKIGISKDSYYLDSVSNVLIDMNLEVYDSDVKLVEALKNGKLSSIILSENKLRFFQNERLKTFLSPYKTLGSIQLGAATNINNKLFIGIINKIIKRDSVYDDIIKSWKFLPNRMGIKYEKSTSLLIIFQIILIFSLIYLMWLLKKLYFLAFYHEETGLPNERLLKRRLKKKKYNNSKKNIGVIAFSIRNFHEISDIYESKIIYQKLKETFKMQPEIIYRINLNEYAFIVSDKSQKETYHNIIKIMEIYKKYYIEDTNIKFNFGMSHLSSSKNIDELLKNMLYSLRLSFKENKVIIGDPKTLKKYRATRILEHKVEYALKKKNYTPYFQPKIDLIKGGIKGAEILARYIGKEEKFISPGVFIPLLEKNNLIKELDLQMLDRGLKLTKKWLDNGKVKKEFIISQNLSMKTLEENDICQNIKDIIIQNKFPVKNLEFEITETALGEDLKLITKNLKEIKSLGVHISIDDFSAGNSSLNYVTTLPIDTIKLDMSILPVAEHESSKIEIYTSFVNTFKKLDYKIVSEGVENLWQNNFLKKINVDEGQGYLYSRPVNSGLFEILVNKYKEI